MRLSEAAVYHLFCIMLIFFSFDVRLQKRLNRVQQHEPCQWLSRLVCDLRKITKPCDFINLKPENRSKYKGSVKKKEYSLVLIPNTLYFCHLCASSWSLKLFSEPAGWLLVWCSVLDNRWQYIHVKSSPVTQFNADGSLKMIVYCQISALPKLIKSYFHGYSVISG